MNQFDIVSRLGEGAFSTVYKVLRKQDNKHYALKKIKIASLNEKEIKNCLNQVRILSSIQNPAILTYLDSFYDEESSTFCIVTEFLDGGDLAHLIKKSKFLKNYVNQGTIWQVALQVLSGLVTLHQMNIFHRDIKPANIFASSQNNIFKLGDMNVSVVSQNGMASTQTGTPYYASPQIWKQKPYNSKCDIWSLGCVLYELAASRPPFMANDIKSLKKCIMKGQYKQIPSNYSIHLQQLIGRCLKVNTDGRPSAVDILNSQLVKMIVQKRNDLKQFQKLLTNRKEQKKNLLPLTIFGKIQPPKKREFHMIKQKLPRSRFNSQYKQIQSNTTIEDESKQNNFSKSNIFSVRATKKNPILPPMKRSQSQSGKCNIKFLQQRVVNLLNEEMIPPLPKQKLIR